MKIQYNIADHKKIDYVKYAITASVLVVLTVLFTAAGIYTWSSTEQRFQDEKAELAAYKEKIENKIKEQDQYKQNINKIRNRWKNRINFANTSLDAKIFPFLEQLDVLEKKMPAGAYITQIILSQDAFPKVSFTLTAISSAKLMEGFKAFLKNDLVIGREEYKNGLFKAGLTITLDVQANMEIEKKETGEKAEAATPAKPAKPTTKKPETKKDVIKKNIQRSGLKNGRE